MKYVRLILPETKERKRSHEVKNNCPVVDELQRAMQGFRLSTPVRRAFQAFINIIRKSLQTSFLGDYQWITDVLEKPTQETNPVIVGQKS